MEPLNLILRPEVLSPLRHTLLDDVCHVFMIKGFDQIVQGPVPERILCRLYTRIRGHEDDLDIRLYLLYLAQELEPIHAGHLDINDNDIKTPLRHTPYGTLPAIRSDNLIPPFEDHAEGLPRAHLIIHNQDTIFVLHLHLLPC